MLAWLRDLTSRERRTMLACWGGWTLDGFDQQLYSYVVPTVIAVWGMSTGAAGTIGTVNESASCSASNHRAPPSHSSACMPLSTTYSTFSGILSLAQLSGSSDQMRLRNGAAQPPPHEAEPGGPHLGRNRST